MLKKKALQKTLPFSQITLWEGDNWSVAKHMPAVTILDVLH